MGEEQKTIAIIGLGYVGLPLAVEFGKRRPVIGFDINAARIAELAAGQDRTLEVDPADLAEARHLRFSSTADDLRAAVGGRPDGLVLECYGVGNAPMARPGMAEALREICESLPVVAVTQCSTGSVDAGRYAVGGELAATGVIDGGDMTLEAALAKLAYGLDAGFEGTPLRSFMRLNLVGERS